MTPSPHQDRSRTTPSSRSTAPARTSARSSNNAIGSEGETIAAAFLSRRGHQILDRNWRAPHGRGELDLVTLDRGRVVIVEVKTRSSLDYGHPFEAIVPKKLERLHRLGWEWCAAHAQRGAAIRVDAVAVLLPVDGPAVIEHLEGVR